MHVVMHLFHARLMREFNKVWVWVWHWTLLHLVQWWGASAGGWAPCPLLAVPSL